MPFFFGGRETERGAPKQSLSITELRMGSLSRILFQVFYLASAKARNASVSVSCCGNCRASESAAARLGSWTRHSGLFALRK